VIDLGRRARIVFAITWVAAQAALVVSASRRADHAFGFRMFSESSTIEIHLARETPDGTKSIENGEWTVKDADGIPKKMRWRDRVRDPVLSTLGAPVQASYGAEAQLSRLQAALDDVAAHTPEDVETLKLVADVHVKKNGRDATTIRIESASRRRP
jgi:hypothetical protein